MDCIVCRHDGTPLLDNPRLYCQKHKEEFFTRCFDCGKEILNNGSITVHKEDYGKLVPIAVCSECEDGNYYECDSCSGIVSNRYYSEKTDGYVCAICYYKEYGIYPWNYKPIVHFEHCAGEEDRTKHLHLGCELEVETLNEKLCRYFYYDENNCKCFFYPKRDGSLSEDYGLEIVSYPMTYNRIISVWKQLFECIKNNAKITYDCGFHVHIDRNYLNARCKRNLDYILNNFKDFGYDIAQREYNTYCDAVYKNREEWGVRNAIDRYEAVNFQNKNTVEVRIFSSTVDYDNFIEKIQNLICLIEYCKKHTFDFFEKQDECNFQKLFKKFKNKYSLTFAR